MQRPSAGARLDRLPICGFHTRVLAIIGSGLFLDALDIYIQGPLLAYFLSSGWSDMGQNANFLSATFAGLLAGTLISGRLSDRFGRRWMYQTNLLIFGLATIAGAFAPTPRLLIACRFVTGLGLGGEVVVSYGTLAEFVPAAVRGVWQGRLALFSNLSVPVSTILFSALLPIIGWRAVMGLIGTLAGVVWLFRRSMPESPRWSEAVGRFEEAEQSLRSIEDEVVRRTGRPLPSVTEAESAPTKKVGLRQLFQGSQLGRTLLAAFLMVCINITVYTFTAWLPTVLLQRAVPLHRSLLITWVMQLGSLPGSLTGAWASERFGRRKSIAVLSACAALTGAGFGIAKGPAAVVIAGFAMFLLVYALVALIFAVYVPEIFPTAIRMTGSSFATACGRSANIFVPQAVPWMLAHLGPSSTSYAISGLLLVQAVVVWTWGTDTEHRPLEEIDG